MKYEYKTISTDDSNLEEVLNHLGGQGFRLVPLSILAGAVHFIMEKAIDEPSLTVMVHGKEAITHLGEAAFGPGDIDSVMNVIMDKNPGVAEPSLTVTVVGKEAVTRLSATAFIRGSADTPQASGVAPVEIKPGDPNYIPL